MSISLLGSARFISDISEISDLAVSRPSKSIYGQVFDSSALSRLGDLIFKQPPRFDGSDLYGPGGKPRDVDIAMIFGTGFPPFRGGLLRYADAIGTAVLVDRLARLADAHGERFRPAGLLRDMVREERRFYAA